MAFGDLTSRPFEGMVNGSLKDKAKRLSAEAVKSRKDTWMSCQTRHGSMNLMFTPKGRVKIAWRDHGGIKEGWFSKEWSIRTTLRNWNALMSS